MSSKKSCLEPSVHVASLQIHFRFVIVTDDCGISGKAIGHHSNTAIHGYHWPNTQTHVSKMF